MRAKRRASMLLGVAVPAALAAFLVAHGGPPPVSLARFVAAHRSTPREIAAAAFPSVVQLSLRDPSGQRVCVASGFFVGPGIVATSFHVLDGAVGGEAKTIGQDIRYQIEGVVAYDERHDLALLRINGTTGPALAVEESDVIAVGDDVFAIGSPGGYEGTFSQGLVSGVRRVGSVPLLQITAPISRGSSGGPILNARGRVVGVTTALVEGEQNLNFASPAPALRSLVASLTASPSALAAWPIARTQIGAPGLSESAHPVAARAAAMWLVPPDGR